MARPAPHTQLARASADTGKLAFRQNRPCKASVPREGAKVLSTQVAWVTGIVGRLVIGAIVGVVVVVGARARSVGFIGDDGAQHADAEPQPEATSKASLPAELNLAHASLARHARGR
jgi:hypothetical protein